MHNYEDFKAQPYLLHNQIQHYAWGTRGTAAFIPQLLGTESAEDTPYAELWMGAHPKAPSTVQLANKTVPLDVWIQQHPQAILGTQVANAFDSQWPFIFKVLSIAAPLSIQAHPNTSQAQALHVRDPEHYPDANHKPEIAIALERLTALVGFKDFVGIVTTLQTYPEITTFIGTEAGACLRLTKTAPKTTQQEAVQQMYTALMRHAVADADSLAQAIDQLASRLMQFPTLAEHEQLFLNTRQIYTGADVGLFALFFLNLVHLERGQGIFLKPGIPHAYLKGNLMECMASSDNVARVGLTPKFKDVDTLIDILTYELGKLPLLGQSLSPNMTDYSVPVAEFYVQQWCLTTGTRHTYPRPKTPAIWLITEGQIQICWGTESTTFARGQAVLLPATLREVEIVALSDAEIFLARVPL